MSNLQRGLTDAGLDHVIELPDMATRFLVEFLLTQTAQYPNGSSFAVTGEVPIKSGCRRIYLSRNSLIRYREWVEHSEEEF